MEIRRRIIYILRELYEEAAENEMDMVKIH